MGGEGRCGEGKRDGEGERGGEGRNNNVRGSEGGGMNLKVRGVRYLST